LVCAVTGGRGDAASGAVMLDGELDRRGGNDPEGHDLAPDGAEAIDDGPLEGRSRLARVPSHDHARRAGLGPPAEGRGPTCDAVTGQVFPDASEDSRTADRQRV